MKHILFFSLVSLPFCLIASIAHGDAADFSSPERKSIEHKVTDYSAEKVSVTVPGDGYNDRSSFVKFDNLEGVEQFAGRFGERPSPSQTSIANRGDCADILDQKYCVGEHLRFGKVQLTLVQILPTGLTEKGADFSDLPLWGKNLVVYRDDKTQSYLVTTAGSTLSLKKFMATSEIPKVRGTCAAQGYWGREARAKDCAQKAVIQKAKDLCESDDRTLESYVTTRAPYKSYSEVFNETYSAELSAKCSVPQRAGGTQKLSGQMQ